MSAYRDKHYVEKLVGYRIEVTTEMFSQFWLALENNKPSSPDLTGFLMGRAEPVFRPLRCTKCNENVLAGEMDAKTETHTTCPPKPVKDEGPKQGPVKVKKEGKK